MDNDTIHIMTCEQAEDELSGYLDDVLDPRLKQNVETHLATCERCQEILADFRRGDDLLRAMPFIEPPADMRDRFFNSPRYLKLANARAHQRNYVTPLTAALVAAAMLVLALGGTLLFRQGLFASQQAGHPGKTTTIGNSGGNGVPLAAGSRLIYDRDNALWSAPESGAGLPQQLSPKGAQVAGWSVSPDGHTVIYIDTRTGALHTIRADGLNDTVVGSVTGGKNPAAGFWTTPLGKATAAGIAWSPDNTRVAYVAQDGSGTALHVMNATGAANTIAKPASTGLIGHPLWSADSVYIVYTATQADAQSIQVYNVTTAHKTTVAEQSDANDSAAMMAQLGWVSVSGRGATITWSTRNNGAITGVFRADANASDSAMRLTPPGTTYSAADVSASGTWLLANGSALSQIVAGRASPEPVMTLAHSVTQVHWAPSGKVAAIVAGDTLALLTPGQGVTVVAHGLAADGLVAWSPDSAALAWQMARTVVSAQVHQNDASGQKTITQGTQAQSLTWSPDGQALAVESSSGLVLTSVDGQHVRASDAHATAGGRLAWSIAG